MCVCASEIVACVRTLICVCSFTFVKAYPTESSLEKNKLIVHPLFGIVFILDRIAMKNEARTKPCNESEKKRHRNGE